MSRHLSCCSRVLLASILTGVLATPAWPQPSPPDPTPEPIPAPSPNPVAVPALAPEPTLPAPAVPLALPSFGPWWRDSELSKHVDLDSDAIDRLEKLFLQHRLRLAELAEQHDRARAALDFERHRREPDGAALRKAEDRVFDLRQRIDGARAELLVEIRAQLSAEQWQKLSEVERRHRPPLAPVAPPAALPPTPERGALRPAPPTPVAPPAPRATPLPDTFPSARPLPAPSPAPAPLPPSAPLPPAPPSLSWWTDAGVRSRLDLSPVQLRQLTMHTEGSASRLGGLSERVRAEERELERLVGAETVDRDAARAQIDRLATARRELLDASRELERDLLGILSSEQRQRLEALAAPGRREF